MPERFMRGIEVVNGIVWGPMGLGLLFGTGLLLTLAPCGSIRVSMKICCCPYVSSRKRLKIGGTQKIL